MSEAKERLPPEVEASYAVIIDSILAKADLNTISAKAIRKGLQAQVDHDISAQKKIVTDLIMARFDKVNAEQSGAGEDTSEPPEPAPTAKPAATNGTKKTNGTSKKRSSPTPDDDDDDDDLSSVIDTPPPKKRTKIEQSGKESDEAYAKRLQAELNRLNARTTRGGGSAKRKVVVKKQRKKKSKDRVGSDDDSDAVSGEKKEVKRTGGFHKPMVLSTPLSELLNETQLSRPQTVKKIWEYIKAHDLQDPNDKRQIICDDALRTVFKTDKVHMFTMNKILNQNLYAVDE